MRSHASSLTRHCLAASAALLILAGNAAAAPYRLAAGDSVEIAVAGAPELKQKSQVTLDGEISLPLGGQLQVRGLTLAEVRTKVRDLLPSREYRRRDTGGREFPVILTPGEIEVTIAEYRPIYLNGDVSKPGEQVFRPGLTVRQAISLAGGYDIMRLRMNNPFLEQADLKGEYSSLWTQFAQEQTRISRLQAELAGKAEFDKSSLEKAPLPTSVASAITGLHSEQMKTRAADYAKEKKYLQEAAGKETGRLKILAEQHAKEEEGVRADTDDLARLQELFQKGNIPITRVVDSRRSLLLASTRQLETAAQLATVERQRDDFTRRSERLDDQRRLDILAELQDANVKLAGLRAKIEASGEKLVYVGMVRSQLVRGEGSKPEIVIHRNTEKGAERITGADDTALLPGDVVEVSLQADLVPGQAAR